MQHFSKMIHVIRQQCAALSSALLPVLLARSSHYEQVYHEVIKASHPQA
jgi:hypothetical protein